MQRRYGGITLGGIIVIVGILLIFVWSFWVGLIVALIGLAGFGGFVRGSGTNLGRRRDQRRARGSHQRLTRTNAPVISTSPSAQPKAEPLAIERMPAITPTAKTAVRRIGPIGGIYAPPWPADAFLAAATARASPTGARSTVQPTPKRKNAEQTAMSRRARRSAGTPDTVIGLAARSGVTTGARRSRRPSPRT